MEAVLIAGDLFDSNVVSDTAIHTVQQIIIEHPEICFYYLKGNHDSQAIFHEEDILPDNLKLFTDQWQYYVRPCRGGQIVIAGAELHASNRDRLLDSLFLPPDAVNLVMLHGQETEYRGQDQTETIPLRELRNRGIDYLALGHVHSFKTAQLDARGIWCYPGCLEGRGFDECGEHGFVLLHIEEETGICEPEFIPFSYRNLYTVYVDVSGCSCTEEMGSLVEQVLREANYGSRHMIKVVLTGRLDISVEKNLYLIKKRLEDRYFYIKVCDETSLEVDYDRYRTDESLRGEYLRMIYEAEEIPQEEKAVLIRYGFQILAGEEIE